MKKEIGGYFEFETYHGTTPHDAALAFNTARNCLEFLISAKRISEIALPFFLCDAVKYVCERQNVIIRYYNVNEQLEPILEDITPSAYLYFVNYYGQFDNEWIRKLKSKHKNLIVDNVQAFFQEPLPETDTIYTCRKFFGVPDGAYLYTDTYDGYETLEQDESYERMYHIMGRFERTGSEFYTAYTDCEDSFCKQLPKKMSKLTSNILRSFNYSYISTVRTENFSYLQSVFSHINKLDLKIPEGPYMYPLLVENGAIVRKKLQEEKIFIPILWPDVFNCSDAAEFEKYLASNILPIPVDQRYTVDDMEYINMLFDKIWRS